MALTSGGVIGGKNYIARGGVREFKGATAPVTDTTHVGVAAIGDRYTDTATGKLYVVTATNGSTTITWTAVGTQT